MHASLWVSKSGLSAQDTRLKTISNNLANVSTTGFKRDRAIFQDLLYQINRQPGGQFVSKHRITFGASTGHRCAYGGHAKRIHHGQYRGNGSGPGYGN